MSDAKYTLKFTDDAGKLISIISGTIPANRVGRVEHYVATQFDLEAHVKERELRAELELGEVLIQRTAPELTPCIKCRARPALVRRSEGLVNVWRAECSCGTKTTASLGQIQAVVQWEKQQDADTADLKRELEDADADICRMCKIINPQHKDCTWCLPHEDRQRLYQ